jgi:GNAT superfamily N-acetyltransferase
MPATIRLARESDADKIATLVARYWKFENIAGFDRPRIVTLLEDFLRQPQRGHCWMAEEDGQLSGYLLAVYLFSLEYGGMMAEIDEFFVLEDKRSSNIGTAMLKTAGDAMAKQGIVRVQLQLGSENLNGKRFYERHGFSPLRGYDVLNKSLVPAQATRDSS